MQNIKTLQSAILVVNNDGFVIDSNDTAIKLFNESLIGKPINLILSRFKDMSTTFCKVGNNLLYFFDIPFFNTPFFKVIEDLYTPIAISDISGNFIYQNDAFLSMVSYQNYTMDKLLDIYSDGTIDLALFKKTKKNISLKAKFKNETLNMEICPFFSNENKITHIILTCRTTQNYSEIFSELERAKKELQLKTKEMDQEGTNILPNLVMESKQMQDIYTLIENMAPKDVTMLLLGKSGTGKSLFAKLIHQRSFRKDKPFITINCSSIPDSLIESELFGYEKGAFTGALLSGKKGLVEAANGGTLFLDEIGELPLNMQAKLLELIQERTFKPVGSIQSKKADIRIIAATNKELLQLVQNGLFREDLYYRIAVAVINIPPLCKHKIDIPILLTGFLKFFNIKHNKNLHFSEEALGILMEYDWPGNIRELQHLVEFLVLCIQDIITISDLPYHVVKQNENISITNNSEIIVQENATLDDILSSIEKQIINDYYNKYKSSYKLASALGISQSKANRLIAKYCR